MNSDRSPGTGDPLLLPLLFFFYFLAQPMEGVVREKRGRRIRLVTTRYVKPKNASLRREKAGKKGVRLFLGPIRLPDPSFVPFRVEIPFFFPSSSSFSSFLGRIRFADPFDG